MPNIVRLGDPLSSGGNVVSASGQEFMGKAAMLLGDSVQCAVHGAGKSVECHPSMSMNDKGVVVDGCKASCGCALISTLPNAGAE